MQEVQSDKQTQPHKTQLALQRARSLKKNLTRAESIFKDFLRFKKIKFNFQEIFKKGNRFYIVDFFLPEKNVIIEIDGKSHSGKKEIKYDLHRSFWLEENFAIKKIIRLKNEQITEDLIFCGVVGEMTAVGVFDDDGVCVSDFLRERNAEEANQEVRCPGCGLHFEIE